MGKQVDKTSTPTASFHVTLFTSPDGQLQARVTMDTYGKTLTVQTLLNLALAVTRYVQGIGVKVEGTDGEKVADSPS